MSAVNLAALAPLLHSRGGIVLGVGPSDDSYEGFLDETKWRHDLFYDATGKAYSGLELKKNGCSNCWGFCICCNSVGSWYKKASNLGYANNASGNLLQFGGTMLVEGGGSTKLLYVHRQTSDDFEPNIGQILTALGATEDERKQVQEYRSLEQMK